MMDFALVHGQTLAVCAIAVVSLLVCATLMGRYFKGSKEKSKSMWLEVTGGPLMNQIIHVPGAGVSCGRDRSNSIVVDERGVSREHFKISCNENGFFLQDLGSTTGTFSYVKPDSFVKLSAGLMLKMGNTEFKVSHMDETTLDLQRKKGSASIPPMTTVHVSDCPFTIGRGTSGFSLVIDDPLVSRPHCRILHKDGVFYLDVMKSTNGTGLRLSAEKSESKQWPLKHGAVFGCGATKFKVSIGTKPVPKESPKEKKTK